MNSDAAFFSLVDDIANGRILHSQQETRNGWGRQSQQQKTTNNADGPDIPDSNSYESALNDRDFYNYRYAANQEDDYDYEFDSRQIPRNTKSSSIPEKNNRIQNGKVMIKASMSDNIKNSPDKLNVKGMTLQEYYNIPEDTAVVTVHTVQERPAPKSSVTITKRIYDHHTDDALGADFADFVVDIKNSSLNFRFFTCVIVAFMAIASLLDFQDQYYYDDFSPLYSLISAYIWIFAIFVITLEGRPFHQTPTDIHRTLLRALRVLRFSWGRGFVYFFSGCLQLVLFTTWNIIAGSTMILNAFITIYFGWKAQEALKPLTKNFKSLEDIDAQFYKHDLDRDGYLNPKELGSLIADLRIDMSYDVFVATFQAIDRNSDRFITREDLGFWWSRYKSRVKRRKASAKLAVV